MTRPTEVLCIGECMMEMAREPGGGFQLAFGGDTFNTAVYLARSGVAASYATALGDDPYSAMIAGIATKESVDTSLIEFRASRMPGLYLIETDRAGERSFFYWRKDSPARELFDDMPEKLAAAMQAARLIYLSGITLWLYRTRGRENLFAALDAARKAGARVVFDGNYRSRLWKSDREEAKAAFGAMLARTDIALPTYEDEHALWGDADASAVLDRLAGHGIAEIVLKQGDAGAVVCHDGARRNIPVPARVQPVDTTAAGDSFNAGYLAARLFGASVEEAALAGHRLAAAVITHRGAIVPERATNGAVPLRPRPASSERSARVR